MLSENLYRAHIAAITMLLASVITYASLTAASGTINVSHGTGGTNGTNSNAAGGGGRR
jgi:hypothetical protein